jgi:hypothetical protein
MHKSNRRPKAETTSAKFRNPDDEPPNEPLKPQRKPDHCKQSLSSEHPHPKDVEDDFLQTPRTAKYLGL